MSLSRRQALLGLAGLGGLGGGGLLATCPAVHAQTGAGPTWPQKPVRVVIPYAAGGPTDIVGRVMAQRFTEDFNQSFVVENKPGAGANLGAEQVARAAPDGQTLLVGTTQHVINLTLFRELKYDLFRDLVAVSQLTAGPLVLVVPANSPLKDVADLVAYAKAHPGALSFASSGNGSSTHLAGEMLRARMGIEIVHVPYKGSGPALADVMGGQVSFMLDTMLSAMPLVKAGKLRALAVTSLIRSPGAPQLPTLAESGLPGYEAVSWNGVFVPARTPPELVARISTEVRRILQLPEVREKFAAQGYSALGSTPEEFRRFVQAEADKWGPIVRASRATID